MCIIIDANVAGEFGDITDKSKKPTPEAAEVYKWLIGGGRTAVGGKHKEELSNTKFRLILEQLKRASRLFDYSSEKLNELTVEISKKNIKSDDPHVLALAIISNCRLLFSDDGNLRKDFKDFLKPSGKLYTTCDHNHLFKNCTKCADPKSVCR